MWQLQNVVLRIGLLIFVIRKTESCYIIAEKGNTAAFSCRFPDKSTVITWQALTGNNNAISLTTCNMVSRMCSHQQPAVYQGRVVSSLPGNYTMELSIKRARINETRFRCLNDRGVITEECELEVYAWPTQPDCEPIKLDTKLMSLELTCTSSNVYPKFSAIINRRGPPGSELDVDLDNSVCSLSDLGSGSIGDVSETCTWRIPASKMPEGVYYFSIAITAFVTDSTKLRKSAVTSRDVTADMRLPRPVTYNGKCPVGPGVVGSYIKVGTSATCTCEVEVGLLGGQAQWFAADGRNVGVDNPSDRSSTLTLNYSASEHNAYYVCRGINPTTREPRFITYQPTFYSSAPGCTITSMLFLLAVSTGLSSTLF